MNHLRICTCLRWILPALACALPIATASLAADPAHVTAVRHRVYAQFERIVLELDRAAPVERPAAEPGQLNVLLHAAPAKERQIVAGAIRIERTEQGATRISAATGPMQVRVFTLPSPPRLVIDLGDPGLTAFVAPHDGTPIFAGGSVRPTEPPPTAAPEPSVAAEPEPRAEPEPVDEPERVAEPEPAAGPEPVAEPEPVAGPEPAAEPEPVAEPEPKPLVEPEPVAETEPVAKPEPVAEPEAVPAPVAEVPEEAAVVAEMPPAVETPPTGAPRPFPPPLRPEAVTEPKAGPEVAAQPPVQTGPAPGGVEAGRAAARPPAPVAPEPAPGAPGGGSSRWWIAAALGLGLLGAAALVLRGRRKRSSFDASTAIAPPSTDIGPEDLLPRRDQIELLEKRLDEEARERLHLESRLAEMSEEQKLLRDRLRRMTRQQRESC